MKKHISLLVGAVAMLGVSPVVAAEYYTQGPRVSRTSADLSDASMGRRRASYNTYQTRSTTSYNTSGTAYNSANGAYSRPVRRSELYNQSSSGYSTTTTNRTEVVKRELKRKYFLAHPFFQPTKGKFGSVTDIAWASNDYKIALNPQLVYYPELEMDLVVEHDDLSAKWKTSQFLVKEDLSFGITDKIAILGMVQYDKSKYTLDWSSSPDDTMNDSGVHMFGIGPQFRFVDNDDWIAMASAYFQHQKDVANNFILELKAGYKIQSTTLYGLARGWYVDFKGDAYGNGIQGVTEDGETDFFFLVFKSDVSDAFYAEGGLGLFSVLAEDWTLNAELVYGSYDWHDQATIRGAFGWQPNDWFALNLYAQTAIYDSADDKSVDYYSYISSIELTDEDTNITTVYPINRMTLNGKAKMSDYKETKIGVQAIFMF